MKPMHITERPRGAVVGEEAGLAVVPAVYRLTRCKDAREALAYLTAEVPESVFRALASHIAGRPALLPRAIYEAVMAYLNAPPELREAEALFAPRPELTSFDERFFA